MLLLLTFESILSLDALEDERPRPLRAKWGTGGASVLEGEWERGSVLVGE